MLKAGGRGKAPVFIWLSVLFQFCSEEKTNFLERQNKTIIDDAFDFYGRNVTD